MKKQRKFFIQKCDSLILNCSSFLLKIFQNYYWNENFVLYSIAFRYHNQKKNSVYIT